MSYGKGATSIPVSIGHDLFDVLVKAGTSVMEAEHLTTLCGRTGVSRYQRQDECNMWWSYVRFDGVNECVWLPSACCAALTENDNKTNEQAA